MVTFTASGIGGGPLYDFQFRLRTPTTTWSPVQGYDASNTWPMDTTLYAPDTYYVQVYVRNAGSTATWEAYAVATYVLSPPPAP